jgi:hypothetical protein
MVKQFALLVGYFKIRINKKSLVGFLRQNCPGIMLIELYQCTSSEAKKAYCCKLTFDSKSSLKRAVKTLRKGNIKGRSFVIREWIERTAANERRDVNWRMGSESSGQCERKKDRRQYHKPLILYVGR